MNEVLARAFVFSRLSNDELNRVHRVEIREGYLMPPCWIHEKMNTEPFGDVEEDSQKRVSGIVFGIWYGEENKAKADERFPSVQDYHRADWEIREKNLSFSSTVGTVSNMRNKLREIPY